ncbi:ArsR family transcriptional regulator [Tahibacter aquaticus]|uniref:ArsR family transcriptional regulator n=1 Tax=Tahibacter aquaticus TaxID=520092 RepID=A0A4R6YQE6_9GAMM|nr:SRPBCC family protein [Tahibacter aquaticus]TDR40093.1 ArsR family transcriptional regulator [Tahibacter aquaticus]
MPAKFVYVTYVRTTPEKLWDALTQPEFTRQFWAGCWHDCRWEKGASWKLMIPDGRVGDAGEVLEIDRPRRLVLSWKNVFMPDLRDEPATRCTIELERVGESVKLTLTHEADDSDSKLLQGVSTGWPHLLASVKSLIETGAPLEETRHWPEGI